MKRQISTLFERICVATIPAYVPEEAFEDLTKKAKVYLANFWPEIIEDQIPLWKFRVSPPAKDVRPEIQEAILTQSCAFWSSPLSQDYDDREWRILIEKGRIVFNYRKHTISERGSLTEFLAFLIPVLGAFRKILGIEKWQSLTLSYYFLYSQESLHATPFFKASVRGVSGGFFDVRKFLIPFRNFPTMDGFEMFVSPYNWQQRWQQKVEGIEYLSGVFIGTSIPDESKNIQISMQLEVQKLETEEKTGDFEEMFKILQGNYSRLICEEAWEELGDDCK